MGYRDEDYSDVEPEEEEEMEEDEEYDEEEEERSSSKKRGRKSSQFIDDVAEEDEDEYDDEDDNPKKKKHRGASAFIDDTADVASDDEDLEDEDGGDDDFIANDRDEALEDEGTRLHHRRAFLPRDDQDDEDPDAMEERLRQRFAAPDHVDYDDDASEVEQQALLPSVRDPKLWMVKCQIGREREAAVCLMQKFFDMQAQGTDLQIRSAVALDHLKGYLYIEADKEAHVREAIKGLRIIFSAKVSLVPIREMTDVLAVESKAVDLAKDTWVRVKNGIYKGDLAKVMDIDNVRQRVTIKLVPRVDLQALANKLEGKDVPKKKGFAPPARFINMREVKDMRIPVERKRDQVTKEVFETIDGMMFKDGYIYKTVSLKSISTHNIQPSFDELQKFQKPGDDPSDDAAGLSSLLANRKKGHFSKGDMVKVIKGDLKNLTGRVEKVEDENILIKPDMPGLKETLSFKDRELCKYFNVGDHVKVVSGNHHGATGMVVLLRNNNLIIVSDTTREEVEVFADNVVGSSEVTSGITKLGDYELHDIVELDNTNFGVIIRVESDGCQILKGVPERAQVVTAKLRDIKRKLFDRNYKLQDQYMNTLTLKDGVRILEGPFKGKQGSIEHMHRGILFIHDRHHLENGGFICARAQSCVAVGGSRAAGNRDNGNTFTSRRPPTGFLPNARRPPRGGGNSASDGGGRGGRGRGRDQSFIGRRVKIRQGPFKGYHGRVVDVNGQSVRIELESQMKVVTANRDQLADLSNQINTNNRGRDSPRYGAGSETPVHASRTPMHPYMTPMRDPSATPMHGMRTPMHDRAWDLQMMTPNRNNSWEDGNPATWGSSSPQYQPGTPSGRAYEAPTPGSGWANTPGGAYNDASTPRDSSPAYANAPSPYLPSTPGGPPMTPSAPSYLPGTPGGQPFTPGSGGLDVMSPTIGGQEGGLMPDIVVSIHRSGEDPQTGVIKDILMDGTCRVALGQSGDGKIVTAMPGEIEVVAPKKQDKIKIISGDFRGGTGRLIGIDTVDGIVKMDETLDIKILLLNSLAKLSL